MLSINKTAEDSKAEDIHISVIMPVYKSEQYLDVAVRSVLEQQFDGFELILVDDGSPDESGRICDDFAIKDSRVVVIHKENGGICSARNAGLQKARGKYVTFCDNDDEYLPGLLADNYALAEQYSVDVVRYSRFKTETLNGRTVTETITRGFSQRVITADNFAENYEELRRTGLGVWTGLYRRAFLQKNNIRFDEKMRYGYEDKMFNLSCYYCGATIALNPKPYYRWLQRLEHSTTGKFADNVTYSLIKCLRLETRMVLQHRIIEKNPGIWHIVLTKDYIAEIYARLRPGAVQGDKKTIIRTLSRFRKEETFDIPSNSEEKKALRRESFSTWLMWTLFQKRKLMLLYRLIYLKNRK